jgi:hypothetical protein
MQFAREHGETSPPSLCRMALALLLCALGFALTVYVFEPAVMASRATSTLPVILYWLGSEVRLGEDKVPLW